MGLIHIWSYIVIFVSLCSWKAKALASLPIFPELAWAFDTVNAIMYCVIMSIKYNENNKQNLS